MKFRSLKIMLPLLLMMLTAVIIPVQAQEPVFNSSDCPFAVPPGENIECGILTVPENRVNPNGNVVEIPVAIIRSTAPNPAPDPIIYLEGGPGGSALTGADAWYESPLRAERDIILFDQRGTGYSNPSLNCRELEDPDAEDAQAAGQACYDRLGSEGVDMSAYNSAENAADVDALRQALGYDQVNLYGISYGTRLALTVERDFPDGLRSVVIDSVYPPEINGYDEQAVHAGRAFRVLFDNCSADPACNAAFPDLENRVYAQVDALNENPATVEFEEEEIELYGDDVLNTVFSQLYATYIIPVIPAALDAFASGDYETYLDLINYGSPENIEEEAAVATDDLALQDAIYEVEGLLEELTDDEYIEVEDLAFENDRAGLADYLSNLFDLTDPDLTAQAIIMIINEDPALTELFGDETGGDEEGDTEELDEDISDSEGMFNAVECNEELPFNSLDRVYELTDAAGLPDQLNIAMVTGIEDQFITCDYWDSGIADALENEPVVSDVPTLVFSGEYDPITPPVWGQSAADHLPNSFHFVFPGVGHGAIDGGDCPVGIALAFLDNPTQEPDSSCISQMRVEHYIP